MHVAVRIREVREAELAQLAPDFRGLVQDAELTTLIAVDGSRILGHVQVSWQGSQHGHLQSVLGPSVAEIRRLRVNPDDQGKGVASALLDDADRRAKSQGMETLGLAAGIDDYDLRAKYRRKGYTEIEAEPFWSRFGYNYDTGESTEKVVVYMTKVVGLGPSLSTPEMANSL